MISIFPLQSFHLYVVTFKQCLPMEHISLRLADLPERVVPTMMSLVEAIQLRITIG